MSLSRRKFIHKLGISTAALPFASMPLRASKKVQLEDDLDVHLFSKHLQFLDLKQAGQMAAELGFNGLDLTVRPKGHVLPENVTSDLPKAIKDIKASGSTCMMMTTAVSDAANKLDTDVIETAAELGVKYYRADWFKYKEDLTLEQSLELYMEKVRQLGEFNRVNNIVGCYQNHSGLKVGASVWEVKKILEKVDPAYFGAQYDIRHAVAEGGRSWPNGVKLLKDQIKTIVLKDFKWGRVDGKWQIVNVPIGEGMVDFAAYFKLLKSFNLKPPVSLHLEYPLGGAEKGRSEITVDPKIVYDAMKKDLSHVQKLWKEA